MEEKKKLVMLAGDNTVLTEGGLSIELLPTGDIKEILWDGQMYNGYTGTCVTGAVGAVYLRVYEGDAIAAVYRLNGLSSDSFFRAEGNTAVYSGQAGGAAYSLRLGVGYDTWYYKLELSGEGEYDVLYTMDTGVGDKGFITGNELYAAQYLGHSVFKTKYGYAIESRQNLSQGTRHPALSQGAIGVKAAAFSTDGLQFFGPEYRVTREPRLLKAHLPSVNHQYEMAFIALETERIQLRGSKILGFYGHAIPDHPDAVSEIDDLDRILDGFDRFDFKGTEATARPVKIRGDFGAPLCGRPNTDDDFRRFGALSLVERGETIRSAFTAFHSHVVGQNKEREIERPHGNILTTAFDTEAVPKNLLSTTNYMYGVFNCQTVAGNTSFNKLLSVARGFLDLVPACGMRVYMRWQNKLRLLTEPTLYEVGLNYSRWIYALADDEVTVTTFTVADTPQVCTQVRTESGRPYEFVVTLQTVMGETENTAPVYVEQRKRTLIFTPAEGGTTRQFNPDLNYTVALDRDYALSDDRIFFTDGKARNGTLLTMTLTAPAFTLTCAGSPAQTAKPVKADFDTERKKYLAFYGKLTAQTRFTDDKWNETLYWFAHNAMVHYAVPHGLEQTGGAAWGTRDVCQGPMEFFLTFGHFKTAENILLRVFSAQNASDGEWPQWFMFDEYPFAADDCHGDIVFWPLKALGDYLAAGGDASVLKKTAPYRGGGSGTVLSHIERALDVIAGRTGGDGLISYAGGDWDDTLQPVSPELKEKLVSAWTMGLAYDTLRLLAETVPAVRDRCEALAARIREGFHTHLIRDGVIAGFGYRTENGVTPLLHPADDETGIHYRLLPLTRSVIAGLVSPAQAEENVRVIEQRLRCPDGVRLMDAPARYEGGVSKIFARAEQAANVGREISLQYVHAHIRYIEAMTVLGRADDAYTGLHVVNPIRISEYVPNARPRQANAYFSSSEGLFNDRYEYKRDFGKLREGSIPVRGGWRIYSSGGGIYLHRLVGDVYGVRPHTGGLELDPVLPLSADGTVLETVLRGKRLTFVYHIKGASLDRAEIDGKKVGTRRKNPYRCGGFFLSDAEIPKSAVIHVYCT